MVCVIESTLFYFVLGLSSVIISALLTIGFLSSKNSGYFQDLTYNFSPKVRVTS